jgi:predicted protein tyrosine phosphatase
MRTPSFKIGKNWYLILSREEAENYECPYEHVLISITDPKQDELNCPDNDLRKDILRLSFHDVQENLGSYRKMSLEEAKQVVEFYLKHKDIGYYVIHCEAGVSRSAAIGAAITILEGDNPLRFWARHYPNGYMISAILMADNLRKRPIKSEMF